MNLFVYLKLINVAYTETWHWYFLVKNVNDTALLIFGLLVFSADKFRKQFGSRSGLTFCLIWIQSLRHSDGVIERIY